MLKINNGSILTSFFTGALNFLFPLEKTVEDLKNIPGNELLTLLPESQPLDETTHTLFAYQDEKVKHLIWEIKYYRNEKITETVGFLLAKKIKAMTRKSSEEFLVIPIPLTNKRLRERGFNHTEMIARAIVKNLPENFDLETNSLKKIRHTPKQSSIGDREHRFRNIVGAFSVQNTAKVAGKNVLIIDDVITTGATVNEARRILEEAGAKTVLIFAVGH